MKVMGKWGGSEEEVIKWEGSEEGSEEEVRISKEEVRREVRIYSVGDFCL